MSDVSRDDGSTDNGTTINDAFAEEEKIALTMSFVEQPLLGREITVPAKLPMILKQFCKAAIRTQPYDLLKWSGSYFRALADGEEPPVKPRLEYPPPSTASGLTLGFLRVLLRQFGSTAIQCAFNRENSRETIIIRTIFQITIRHCRSKRSRGVGTVSAWTARISTRSRRSEGFVVLAR